MENPYQTPRSSVRDLAYQPLPKALLMVYWVLGLAYACDLLMAIIAIVDEIPFLSSALREGIFLVVGYLLVVFLGALGFILCFYYFMFLRPLSKRLASSSRWFFWGAVLWGGLWVLTSFIPSEPDHSLSQWFSDLLGYVEIGLFFVGAFLLSRPAAKQHLPN